MILNAPAKHEVFEKKCLMNNLPSAEFETDRRKGPVWRGGFGSGLDGMGPGQALKRNEHESETPLAWLSMLGLRSGNQNRIL